MTERDVTIPGLRWWNVRPGTHQLIARERIG